MKYEMTAAQAQKLAETWSTVEAPLLTWMTVHGNLCLALRHPGNSGASRKLCTDFVKTLSDLLVDTGAMTREQIDAANRIEGL